MKKGNEAFQKTKNINDNDITKTKSPHFLWNVKVILLTVLFATLPFFFKPDYQISTFHNNSTRVEQDGWNDADVNILNKYSSFLCTIDRVFISDLNDEKFEKEFRNKKPVLLQFPHGASYWTNVTQWYKSTLITNYGTSMLSVGKPREIVRHGGNGEIGIPLDNYITNFMTGDSNSTSTSNQYVFDRHFFKDSDLDLNTPSFLKIKEGVDDVLFFLGSSTTGVSFHKHAEGWNGVIFGQKRWFLYPKTKTPPGGMYPGYSQLDWFKFVYPNLASEDRPLECVQKAGEILYLPESMYHSTINIGDTLAIGVQKIHADTTIEQLFYEDNDFDRKGLFLKRIRVLKKLLQLLPDNAEVYLKLGSVYESLSDIASAERYYEQAVKLDPHFLVALVNIARLKSKQHKVLEAEDIFLKIMAMNPNIWDVYAEYGTFLMTEKRFEDAVNIFQKGCKLQPLMRPFWEHLRYCQHKIGDIEGVQQSEEELKYLDLL